MAQDYFKPKGKAKASKPDAGGGVIRSEPALGVVKNNIDPTRGGRIQVYIADFGAPDPDDSSSWITVSYLSPFFGATQGTAGQDSLGSFITNPSSYGMWFSPPDIGSTVVCIFVNGDMNYGYYIGGVPTPELLQMVPAIGSSENVTLNKSEATSYGGATKLPVTNLNTNNSALTNDAKYLNAAKPVHSYLASILAQQGLIRDPIRGPITSSALRESPSRVGWGVSTPGRPIYSGGYTDNNVADAAANADDNRLEVVARRGGHSIVMDDGDLIGNDQLVRIRSALGHQILMSDDGQTLFIIHSNGQSYIELGKEGTIDMYATNSVNIRTQGDLNLHADNNININAVKDLNIAADNINMQTETDINFRAGANFKGYTLGTYTIKVDGPMSMGSGGSGSYASSGDMFINGSRVNLNTGETSTAPDVVAPLPSIAHTDTLFDKAKGWAAAPAKLLSIVSRAPAHAPWSNANQGVDVKVSNNASDELAEAPTGAVEAANNSAASAPTDVTNPSLSSTVPATASTSESLTNSVTSSMVSTVATNAANIAPNVVSTGAGVFENSKGILTAGVGDVALTPNQLERAGVLKPGASTLVNSLVQGGANVQSAMTNNLFTGKAGAETLLTISQNTTAQVKAQVENFQHAQTGLTSAGIITGKEAPSQIAGLVVAGATAGLPATIDFVKNSAGNVANAVGGVTSGATSDVAQLVASGNFAASMATTVTGGTSSITTALNGVSKSAITGLSGLVDSAKGVAGSAFSAITKSFKAFIPGIPQNLKEIAATNAKQQSINEARANSSVVDQVSGEIKSNVPSLTNPLTKAVILAAGPSLVNKLPSASALASGLTALPGGEGAVSSVIGNSGSSLPNFPSIKQASDLIKNTSAAVQNSISDPTAILSGNVALSAGSMSDVANKAESLVSNPLAKGLAAGTQSLTSLASAGLPAAAAASLQASISSLSSASPFPIKLPTVSSNTTNRGEVTALLGTVLGDKRIPTPDFKGTGPTNAAKAEVARLDDLVKQQQTLIVEKDTQGKKVDNARQAYLEAKNNLPQGDPVIASAKQTYIAEVKAFSDIVSKISELANKA
jgi:Type VI secretion system/phage-baseplate injector OB domain